jgi:hypothetical protein
MNSDLNTFLQAWSGGGDITAAESERVLQRFENDSAFRSECIDEIRMLGMLKAVQSPPPRWLDVQDAIGLAQPRDADVVSEDFSNVVLQRMNREGSEVLEKSPNRGWFTWRPLTAAAAGLTIGLLSASVVYGIGTRSVGKAMSILQDSFESGPAPLVAGVPKDATQWSGDYSEVVGEGDGLKPRDGSKMVRLLRSDHEGRTVPRPSRQGDLMRIIDVRPFVNASKGVESVVTLSALFNAVPCPAEEIYDGMVTVYALAGDIHLQSATEDTVRRDALAFSLGRFGTLDRDTSTWQQASAQLLLPPGTEFVMLKVSVLRKPPEETGGPALPDSVSFAGHFVDDVRASIRTLDAAGAPAGRPKHGARP